MSRRPFKSIVGISFVKKTIFPTKKRPTARWAFFAFRVLFLELNFELGGYLNTAKVERVLGITDGVRDESRTGV